MIDTNARYKRLWEHWAWHVRGKRQNPRKTAGFWHLVGRVPKEFACVDKRRFVTLTTGVAIVDDPKGVAAQRIVRELDDILFAFWRDWKAGRNTEGERKYSEAVKLSREVGFPYRPNHELLIDVNGLVERLEALEARHNTVKKDEAFAVIGAVAKPAIMLSAMINIYKELNIAAVSQRSPAQQHRWDTSGKTALDTFIEIIGGDRPMSELDFETVMTVNVHVQKRIANKEIVHDTGNKLIGRVAALWRDINRQKRLNLPDCFHGTRIKGEKTASGWLFRRLTSRTRFWLPACSTPSTMRRATLSISLQKRAFGSPKPSMFFRITSC
jgi:hypothetical protein